MGYLLQNGGLGMAGDWIITGGRPLQGRVEVPAAKNSVLPLLAASLLCSGPVRLQNVPRLTDVVISFILPAILCPLINQLCRKAGWVKDGDLKLP